mmetsp:Transcript_130374/g.377199  ORF Transcript_130374/g.377199 Transcript_130374/m.377199 type:complete len:243 (+) Transcript_130374:124-852(+)
MCRAMWCVGQWRMPLMAANRKCLANHEAQLLPTRSSVGKGASGLRPWMAPPTGLAEAPATSKSAGAGAANLAGELSSPGRCGTTARTPARCPSKSSSSAAASEHAPPIEPLPSPRASNPNGGEAEVNEKPTGLTSAPPPSSKLRIKSMVLKAMGLGCFKPALAVQAQGLPPSLRRSRSRSRSRVHHASTGMEQEDDDDDHPGLKLAGDAERNAGVRRLSARGSSGHRCAEVLHSIHKGDATS